MADPPPLRLLVAADKFKGSLTGPEACEAIARGLRDTLGDTVEIESCPVADGGDGMARAITEARDGSWHEAEVEDALGRPLTAGFGLVTGPDGVGIGIIEMAEASGLWRLDPGELNPWEASTFGTGQLVRRAIEAGAESLLLGIGGSATNDGGVGMMAALGFRFLDENGSPVSSLPADLEQVRQIQSPSDPIPPLKVACDVTNPLLGPEGCTAIYGPQKGVTPDALERHEQRLAHLVDLLGERGAEARSVPGSGAAGGLGFGCLAFLDAELRPGFDLVAEILGLEARVEGADLVITGEGKLDRQTLQGKAPAGVAALARSLGKPVAAFAGTIPPEAEPFLSESFDHVAAIEAGDRSLEETMRDAFPLLRETARRQAETIAALGLEP